MKKKINQQSDQIAKSGKIESFSHRVTHWAGSTGGFITATITMFIWLIAGEYYKFSTDWENALTIYIGVLTFLLVFLFQRSSNKGLAATHIKLNEIISALEEANNELINVEELSEKEIKKVHDAHEEVK